MLKSLTKRFSQNQLCAMHAENEHRCTKTTCSCYLAWHTSRDVNVDKISIVLNREGRYSFEVRKEDVDIRIRLLEKTNLFEYRDQ